MPTPCSKPATGSCWPTPRMNAVSVVLVPREAFERHVRRGLRKIGDVQHAAPVQLLTGIGGNGDRHVEQKLVAAPRGDGDRLVARRCRQILGLLFGRAVGLVSGPA